MLPPAHRIRRDAEVARVIRQGRPLTVAPFRLKTLPTVLPVFRAAVVVSTKVSKKATVRNRLRRQTTEILRLRLSRLRPGVDVVIWAQPGAPALTFSELEQLFDRALRQARLFS